MDTKTILLNDNHLGALVHFRLEVINALAAKQNRIILTAPSNGENVNYLELNKEVEILPVNLNRTSLSVTNILKYFFEICGFVKKTKS